ncbi:tetratricopeptide repeat protein [Vibrio sonorensis]|uniref:tetratricopeptide repeat protein n=1 Tax=Vibrio sonorensis TaxID=1004316 RepID=UPI0008D902CA|nr:hypothetical protein [Vibrio sonorensis]
MLNLRWDKWIAACLILICQSALADHKVYSSPILNEANNLVDIVPQQSRQLATNFLTQRRLSEQTEKSPSSISRDEADARIRTPGGTIDAMRILAQAEFNLGNQIIALTQLENAAQLAEKHQLPYLKMEVQLLAIRLLWQMDNRHEQAKQKLLRLEHSLSEYRNQEQLAPQLRYEIEMLRADIASKEGNRALADEIYAEQGKYVFTVNAVKNTIDYHISVGTHLLNNKSYNLSLSELLTAYWMAIEDNSGAQLAKINSLLGQLFYERRVLDKANDHLSQAADFYDNYEKSPVLPTILKRMGDIYYYQGKYNLALVHYFNAIDHERIQNNLSHIIELRVALASTYLQLVNFPLAQQYLDKAKELLEYTDIPELKARTLLLESGLAYYQESPQQVIDLALQALELSQQVNSLTVQKRAYQLLYLGYELDKQYKKALGYLKQYNAMANIEQQQLDSISEDAFRQQKEFVEQTLHLVGQKQQLDNIESEFHKFQKIAFTLFLVCTLLFMFLLRRGHVVRLQKEEIDELNDDLYTHSRSGLKNLRMLNAKLPASLEESSHKFEKWHVGELIHEPLNDRLRFVMIDVPFLRNMYLQYGYAEGLKLEKAFGDFLQSKIQAPARIYHFSDANLLYIEASNEQNASPEYLYEKVQQWLMEFEPDRRLNRIVRIGMADYPFLPRAYTAINDKELVDILLMSTSAARTLSMKEHASQWVYLKAIENAPAASLATGNIRKACKHSISQGLIKVHSSYKNEESIKKLLKDD